MSEINWNLVEEEFCLLPLREQMMLLERLQRQMRECAYPELDTAENDRLLDEMANDPTIQQELRFVTRSEPEAPIKETA